MNKKPFFGRLVTLEERFADLEPVVRHIFKQYYTVLDIGCAEGNITNHIAKLVKHVYAFDNDRNKGFVSKCHNVKFHWGEFPKVPYFGLPHFDVVLCMGVYNKLKEQDRLDALTTLIAHTNRWLIIRSDQDVKFIKKFMIYSGFKLEATTKGTNKASPALIFKNPAPYQDIY